ncbi:MAG: winged helix DNA-binding domain-containing protein [Actinomycetia bacterium]|nr:winged helix DNA-binding domain-containing protein [Actinomycetes bacterium]
MGKDVAVERLTGEQARRIALAAQGFADPRPSGRIDARHIRRVIDRVGLLQLDSVNVFCRSHYLPVFARIGPYPRDLLDRMAGHSGPAGNRGSVGRSGSEGTSGTGVRDGVGIRSGEGARHGAGGRDGSGGRVGSGGRGRGEPELFEYWGHEASLLPLALQPMLRWRMDRAARDAWDGIARLARDAPGLIEDVCALVAERGPIRAADTGAERAPRRPGAMWNWHDGKVALEYLFWAGRVTSSGRVNFERRYDLPERVLPSSVLGAPTPPVEDAQRHLVRVAARALGVATEPDLGDYFRLPRAESKARVAELVAAGELREVSVDGWRAPGYRWPAARAPRQVCARALLSPFDSLIWRRERAERLFGFRYRVEIYTPARQRVHGYYVLPFLLDDALVARVDLKSDRQAEVLRVRGAHAEPGIDRARVAAALAEELAMVARWLGLAAVAVEDRGDLAASLRARL